MDLFMEPEIQSQKVMLAMIIALAFKYFCDYAVLSHVSELFLLTVSLES